MDHQAHAQMDTATMMATTPQTSQSYFSIDGFMPHGHCYLWKPELVTLHVVSDAVITLAYFCIPFVLLYMFKKRPDIPYKWVFGLFAAFILACGTTHLLEIWTLWTPDYWLSGFVKGITAVISIATAAALIPLVPKVLTLRGPAELEKINRILQQEVEERKRIEAELIRAAQLKSSFLANMSHEIRTPLNGIIGLTSSVLDSEISPDQQKSLELVRKSGEHLFSLLNDILDFSKIEAGKLEFEQLNFSLNEFLSDTVEMHRIPAQSKGLKLEFNLDNSLPEQIKADPTRIRQVLNNLIGNAIKFTSKGAVTIQASAEKKGHHQYMLNFSITDTGIGIPEHKQQEIFNSFSQADVSTSRKFGGSGLGLSISRKLVEMMGGRIQIKSVPHQGTTFLVQILVDESIETLVQHETDTSHPVMEFDKDIRVLVAEDNAINQIVTGKMLEKFGIRPDYVANGKEALAVLDQNSYDIILMDCQMPEMDGYQATQKIRNNEQKNPNAKRITIIAMTASAMKGDREKCLEAGMDDYITKPVRLSDLYGTLKHHSA